MHIKPNVISKKSRFTKHLEVYGHPIVFFNLKQLGINEALIDELASSFNDLHTDNYEYKRTQLAFLCSKLKIKREWVQQFALGYFKDENNIEQLDPILSMLSDDDLQFFKEIRPLRTRAACKFELTRQKGFSFNLKEVPMSAFTQKTQYNEFHNIDRIFINSPKSVTENSHVHNLLIEVINCLLLPYHPNLSQINIILHQMQLMTHDNPQHLATNAPEGIHQDGTDYLVSALVVKKENADGGISKIYAPDKKTCVFEHALEVGEGLFMRESPEGYTENTLWHTVTPIHSLDNNKIAIRSIIGLDIHIHH